MTDHLGDPITHPPTIHPQRRPPAAAAWWLALGFICFLIFGLQMTRSAETPDGLPDPASYSSIELKLIARYAVGVKVAAKSFTSLTGDTPDSLAQALEKPATAGPIDELRAAAVIAELQGPQAGLDRLNKLESGLIKSDDAQRDALLEDLALFRRAFDLALYIAAHPIPLDRADGPGMQVSAADTEPPPLTPDERDRLITRHGWFGHLAIAQGQDDFAPDRALIERTALRTVVVILAAGGAGLLAILAGFTLFIIFIIKVSTGGLRLRYPEARARFPLAHAAFLQTGVLFLALFILVSVLLALIGALVDLLGGNFEPAARILLPILMWIVALITLFPLARGVSLAELRAAYGWHANGLGFAGVLREIGSGVIGYLAGLPILITGLLLTILLTLLTSLKTTHPIQNQLEVHSAFDALMLYLLAAVWAPIVEETIFRGALFHHLRRWTTMIPAALTTAFIFAVIHPQGYAGIPALISLAFTFALLREWRGSIIASMTAHALNNAVVLTLGILMLS